MSGLLLIVVPLLLAGGGEKVKPDGKDHWAFRPVVRPALPSVKNAERARTDVDRFIEAALEAKGLSLGPEAGRAVLLRRVSFDLTGLPPSPLEVAAFLADPAPDAYERMVERYLASPRYGERWGRQWLDAAGFAESNGYFSADSERPLAYRYRDYVVRSLNSDKPFDRFIEEQLAGDELARYQPDGDVGPETAELLTATHFLRNAQDGTGESDGNDLEVLIDKLSVLDGTTQIVATSLLGLTFQCARCHDHKFDPVSQVEYYRLQAVFAPAYDIAHWLKPAERVAAVGTRAEREEGRKKREAFEKELQVLKDGLEGLAAPFRKQIQLEKIAALEEPARSEVRKALEAPRGERSDAHKALLKKHADLLKVTDEEVAKRFGEFAKLRGPLVASIEAKEKERPPPPDTISALYEARPDPARHRLLKRGLASEPGPEVEPGVPAVLETPGNVYRVEPRPPGRTSSGSRLALARWITSPENPLLARVTVNRIWQGHFGAGLVATSENLGVSGAPPSHPELLDYLATELVRGGWRLKPLHRLILSSSVYRQSSALRSERQAVDPEERLLGSFRLRRLDAESLRDAMLCVSGELDRRMGGPSVPTRRGEDGQVVVGEKEDGAFRRSIYLQARRTQPLGLLEAFDAPLIVGSCTRRNVSTTPIQSLSLLNSEFVLLRARAFWKRVDREAGPGRDERIALAFLLGLGRGPGSEERALAERFLESQTQGYAAEPEAAQRAWIDLCQMIFASNAFLYVD